MSSTSTVDFWDNRFSTETVNTAVFDADEQVAFNTSASFFGDVNNKTVLDIGCGIGKNSIAMARRGAKVTAADSSQVAIDKLNDYARINNLSITGVVCDCMKIGDLGQFDFVIGSMILHHLEPFDRFSIALADAMKIGGKAAFYENSAASRFLVWMREHIVGKLWVPKYGDADEFPLKPQEVDMLRRRFDVVQDFPELMFFRLGSQYLFKGKLEGATRKIDDFLYKHNILVRYSYRQILLLTKLAQ